MNSAINATQQSPPPWERLSNESAKAFAAFCVYRDLPPSRRSLDEAGRIIHGTQEGRKKGATGRLREGAEIRCRSIILAQRNPKKSGVSPSLTFPTKVPSDSLGRIGSLKRTSDKSLFPMALGSCGHRITHQLRPINMNGRSILAVTSSFFSDPRPGRSSRGQGPSPGTPLSGAAEVGRADGSPRRGEMDITDIDRL